MKRNPWLSGMAVGALVGLVVAAIMTILDWRLNPGGIFRHTQGTDWIVVAETFVSWFGPVAVVVSALTVSLLHWLRR